MEGQGLLVELGRLDGPGGALDAEADEVGGRDGLSAHGANRNQVDAAALGGAGGEQCAN